MGKIKSRARKPFVGYRKNKKLMTKKKIENTESDIVSEIEEDVGLGHAEETSTVEATSSSASATKLSVFGFDLESELSKPTESVENKNDFYLLAQNSCLERLFSQVLCPECKQKNVRFHVDKKKFSGLAASCNLICSNCEFSFYEDDLCQRVGDVKSTRSPFEVNILATLAFRGIGCGYTAMKDWCGTMNIGHCMTKNAYQKNQIKLEEASKKTFAEVSKRSVKAIFEAYAKVGVEPDEDGILDISVSFDGSWQKRGHSSHNGMAAVIDLLTGLPIDTEVLSNYCPKCKQAEKSETSDNWRERHAKNCPKNFDGTSNAMETECAKRLWARSVEKYSLRYMTMLSDGDSKSFDAISVAEVYGKDKTIEKEECINHISKRMGTALKKLVETSKNQGVQISGKGRLTKEKILKIQNYYGKAIKDNAHDIQILRKRIFAILYHLSSSNSHPKHMHCPPGPGSWCFWQKAQSNSQEPGSHKEHETLPADVGKILVPVFQRLADEKLLKRCMRAKTQNANESLHNIVWKICPKAIYAGRKTVETAVALAACQFSMGATFKLILCKTLNIEPGLHMQQYSEEKTLKRLRLAQKASSQASKRRRKVLKYKNLSKEAKKKQQEGPTYAAGNF